MTDQFERFDRWMAEDAALRLRIGRLQAATAKAGEAALSAKTPKDQNQYFVHLVRRPGEGKILRTTEGCSTTIYYDDNALAEIAKRTPWILPELLAELERNKK